MPVGAKNQWGLKFLEKCLKFTYKNLNGKLTFIYFLSHLPDLSHFIQLWKITQLFNNNLSVSGGIPLRYAGPMMCINKISLKQFFRFRGGAGVPLARQLQTAKQTL